MKEIALTRGLVAWIDDRDYDAVMQYEWKAVKRDGRIVAVARSPTTGRTKELARFLLRARTGETVLRRNLSMLDCRRENLVIGRRNAAHEQAAFDRVYECTWGPREAASA